MFQEQNKAWNHNKIKAVIDHYGYKFFYNKTVLDLGAGNGDCAAALARLGATVLCVDARQQNINLIQKNYPFLQTMVLDIDNDWVFLGNQFDIVLSLGLLCHIKNYEKHIDQICDVAEHIIIETEILDSTDPGAKIPIFEERAIHHLSYHGEGSIVSALNLQHRLSEKGATFKRIDHAKINDGDYRYDWAELNEGRKFGNRRLWIAKRDKLIGEKLRNQEKIRGIENSLIRQMATSPPISLDILPKINHSKSKIKSVALCLFGDIPDNLQLNYDFDVFIYSNNNKASSLSNIKCLIEDISLSEIDKFFHSINQVVSLKEKYEQSSFDVYGKVIICDFSNISLIEKFYNENTENKFITGNFKIFATNSLISDIFSNIVSYIPDYLKNGCKNSINSLIDHHMKEFGISVVTR